MIDRTNVLVYIFKRNPFQLLILRRTSDPKGVWQPVSGGVEGSENFIDTVKREVMEETSITKYLDIIDLDYSFDFYVPSSDRLMRDHCFGYHVENETEPTLSHEHDLYKWVSYEEALDTLEYDENKIVLTMLLDRLGEFDD